MFDVFSEKNYKIVCWKIEKLQKNYKSIKNWKYNREADATRINDIKSYMDTSKINIVPGLICGWDNGECLEIYDGFHRYSACNYIPGCKILIKIIQTTDENVIKKDFELVNKSLYVPASYLENNLDKNRVCLDVFNLMKNTFPKNVSFSNNPQQQNFNQNNIIEIVSLIQVNFSEPRISNKIYLEMLHVNDTIKKLGLKPRYKKTSITGFWLFFWDFEKIIDNINDKLKK